MKTIEGTFGGEIQIFEEANVYVILDNSTIYLLPKEKNQFAFMNRLIIIKYKKMVH